MPSSGRSGGGRRLSLLPKGGRKGGGGGSGGGAALGAALGAGLRSSLAKAMAKEAETAKERLAAAKEDAHIERAQLMDQALRMWRGSPTATAIATHDESQPDSGDGEGGDGEGDGNANGEGGADEAGAPAVEEPPDVAADVAACRALLDRLVEVDYKSDVLHAFRARACRQDGFDDEGLMHTAILSAKRAVELNPTADHEQLLATCLQQGRRLHEAGLHFLQAHKRGDPAADARLELGYAGLLATIRRTRRYFSDAPAAMSPLSRADWVLRACEEDDGMRPSKPRLVAAEVGTSGPTAATLRWTPLVIEDDPHSFVEYVVQTSEWRTVVAAGQRPVGRGERYSSEAMRQWTPTATGLAPATAMARGAAAAATPAGAPAAVGSGGGDPSGPQRGRASKEGGGVAGEASLFVETFADWKTVGVVTIRLSEQALMIAASKTHDRRAAGADGRRRSIGNRDSSEDMVSLAAMAAKRTQQAAAAAAAAASGDKQAMKMSGGTGALSALRADKKGLVFSVLKGLKEGTRYRVRVQTRREVGESDWSEPLELKTPQREGGGDEYERLVPLSWLYGAAACTAIASEECARTDEPLTSFFEAVADVLTERLFDVMRTYSFFAAPRLLTPTQFVHILREAGLVNGAQGGRTEDTPDGIVPIGSVDADLMFQRHVRTSRAPASPREGPKGSRLQAASQAAMATQPGMQGPSAWQKASRSRKDVARDLRLAAEDVHAELVESAPPGVEAADDFGEGGGDGGAGGGSGLGMALFQWVGAMVEVGWKCFPELEGVEFRLEAALDAVFAVSLPLIDRAKQKRAGLLSGPRVEALFDHFGADLKAVFRTYCVADVQAAFAGKSLEMLNIHELQLMMQEAGIVDGNITMARVESIFGVAKAEGLNEGVDNESDTLSYEEFCMVLSLLCDAKVPEERRGDEPFEYALHAWLQLSFVPAARRAVKARVKTVGRAKNK